MIIAIFACDEAWGIGKNGNLPWPKNKDDLDWFKRCTAGHAVVMGRKTWESLPIKPLPNRLNFVISKSNDLINGEVGPHGVWPNDPVQGIISLEQVLKNQIIWIIGGAQLMHSCLDVVDEIWLSRIDGTFDCDTFLDKELILQTFEKSEQHFDGSLRTEKYLRKADATIS